MGLVPKGALPPTQTCVGEMTKKTENTTLVELPVLPLPYSLSY